jgi:hypothetical protein
MVSDPTFEIEGDIGVLRLQTHFGHMHEVTCTKEPGESFRVGGTAISELSVYEAVLLATPEPGSRTGVFRAFKTERVTFEGEGVLSPEDWQDEGNRHCFISEHYPLDVEGQRPKWLISKRPVTGLNLLYANVDVLDGGGNIMKRYRVCMTLGDHIVLENV